jgi:hypothetical protein
MTTSRMDEGEPDAVAQVWRDHVAGHLKRATQAIGQLSFADPAAVSLRRSFCAETLREIFEQRRDPAEDEVDTLSAEMARHLSILSADVSDALGKCTGALPELDEMLWADAVAARHIAALGESGKAWAAAIRLKAPARLRRFKGMPFGGEQLGLFAGRSSPGAPEWASGIEALQDLFKLWLWTGANRAPDIFAILAETLWRDVVEARVAERKHPAIARGVEQTVDKVLWAPGRRMVQIDGAGQALLLLDGLPVAKVTPLPRKKKELRRLDPDDVIEAPTIEREIADYFASAHTLTCWKLVRHIVIEMYRKHFMGDDSAALTYEGGIQTLADELGIKGGKGAQEVRQALDAGWAMAADWPDGGAVRGLWVWSLEPAAPGRPAILNITVASQLRPGYAAQIPKRRDKERQLLPVLEDEHGRAYLPPRLGSPQLALKQVRLSGFVIEFFRERATELQKHGHVRISDADWASLAKRAGLQPDDIGPLVDRWTQDPGAFLERKGADRYTLAPAHRRALATLMGAAKKSIEGAKRQAARRWAGKRAPQSDS